MKEKLIIFIFAICWSCNSSTDTEKYQNKRNNIIHIQELVKEINIEEVLISQFSSLFIINDYLLISDSRSPDKLIHIFNKNDYSYITSILDRGQGTYEITGMGFIGINEDDNKLYVTDHGKQKIFSYSLDSILTDTMHIPQVKMKMDKTLFPDKYQYINDTLLMGVMIEPTGTSGFNHAIAKINANTGKIRTMTYKHPKIERKRVCFAASIEHGIFVECYNNHDLITFCDLDGNLKYNIYGKKWNDKTTNKFSYYEGVIFTKENIIASFGNGKNRYSNTDSGYPEQFLIFDTKGNYFQTLDTGMEILDFCYDKDNNRIIMNLNEEMQFAYIELDGVIK